MLRVTEVSIERDEIREGQETALDHHYFCLVTYGKCLYWVDQQRMTLDKGDVLLIPPRHIFKWRQVPSAFHSKHIVHFHAHGDSPRLPLLMRNRPVHFHTGQFSILYEKLKALGSQWMDKMPYYEAYASALFVEVLVLINRELDKGPATPEKYRYAEMMKNYIHENYRSKITKEELADVIRKSPNYTATLFRKVTGQTISEYLHSVRIKTALYMLEESRLTVAELAEFLGYSDVSYFSRVFKQTTGASPSEYKQHRSSLQ